MCFNDTGLSEWRGRAKCSQAGPKACLCPRDVRPAESAEPPQETQPVTEQHRQEHRLQPRAN